MDKLKYFRTVLIIGIPSNLAWGWLGQHFIPGSYDSVEIRLYATMWGIVVLAGSYFSEFVKKHIENLTYPWGVILFFYYMFMCSHESDHAVRYWHLSGLWALGPIVTIVIVARWPLYIWVFGICALSIGEAIHTYGDNIFFTFWLNMLTMVSVSSYFSIQRIAGIEKLEAANLQIHEKNKEMTNLYEMAAQAAHDIRSPVTALQMVYRNLNDSAPERELIQGSIKRINGIAEDMLAANARAKAGSRGNASQVADSNIENIFNGLMGEFNVRYPSVAINLDLASNLPDSYALKPQDLARIISNLLNNAIEADANSICISAALEGDRICIKVRDNGRGIPLDKQKNLFKRGFTFGKQSGNGLGLYGARQILKASSGEIGFRSDPQVGTTFIVAFK